MRDSFKTARPSPANARRQALAIGLGSVEDWTPINRVIERDLSLTRSYAAVSPKTLTRDVNTLQKLGIIWHAGLLVRPRIDRIHAMLPVTATAVPESGKLAY